MIVLRSYLPHTECSVLGNLLQHSHHLQTQGIASPSPAHVLLLAVHRLTDVHHQLLHQIPARTQTHFVSCIKLDIDLVKTYLSASWFIRPKAFTAASRTSTTSHRRSGTTSL